MLADFMTPVPLDVLPDQIMEDEEGNMHIVSEDYLVSDESTDQNVITENELGLENMENYLPCSDVSPEVLDL